MWLCNVEGAPEVRWAAPTDMSGHYGLTHVVCESVTFSADPNPGYSLTSFRGFLRLMKLILDL